MSDLLKYINSYINPEIFKILENSFDENKPFLDALLSRLPLILLDRTELLNCKDNICENILFNYSSIQSYYYSIEILKQFGLIECQKIGICTLSNRGEKILRKYILENDLSTIVKAGYEYNIDKNLLEKLGKQLISSLCKNPNTEEMVYPFPNQYLIHYFIIKKLDEGLKNNTPYIIEFLAGNKKPISLFALFLSYLHSPNWSFREDYLIEIIEKIAGESCVNSLFAAKRRREYNISITLATMPRFVIKDRSNSVYKRYKISEEGKKFVEYILMQIYPVKYFYRN
jgi:predicted transcriptional regulator